MLHWFPAVIEDIILMYTAELNHNERFKTTLETIKNINPETNLFNGFHIIRTYIETQTRTSDTQKIKHSFYDFAWVENFSNRYTIICPCGNIANKQQYYKAPQTLYITFILCDCKYRDF